MHARRDPLQKTFKSFRSGNSAALSNILSAERPRLFDYVMRMTGQVAKSAETTSETIDSIEHVADSAESLEELVILLYKTARNFAIDAWNADTTKLENSAYSTPLQGKDKDPAQLIQVEQIVRALSPIQRESLILVERFWFATDEVAEIMGLSHSDVEIALSQAQSVVERSISTAGKGTEELIGRLQPFAEPETDSMQTQNLSLIMNDFRKTARGTGRSVQFWVTIVVIVVAVAYAWLHQEDIKAFWGF